jgi:hypothetical protein
VRPIARLLEPVAPRSRTQLPAPVLTFVIPQVSTCVVAAHSCQTSTSSVCARTGGQSAAAPRLGWFAPATQSSSASRVTTPPSAHHFSVCSPSHSTTATSRQPTACRGFTSTTAHPLVIGVSRIPGSKPIPTTKHHSTPTQGAHPSLD